MCGATCVDPDFDNSNCGGCGNVCPTGSACVGSQCQPSTSCDGGPACAVGQSCRATGCTDTTSDDNNCGSCGHACDAGICITSTCQVSTTYKVGNYTLFTGKSSHSPDFLLGSQLTLTKAAKLIDFGVISISTGQDVTMALYTDSGGAPDP